MQSKPLSERIEIQYTDAVIHEHICDDKTGTVITKIQLGRIFKWHADVWHWYCNKTKERGEESTIQQCVDRITERTYPQKSQLSL